MEPLNALSAALEHFLQILGVVPVHNAVQELILMSLEALRVQSAVREHIPWVLEVQVVTHAVLGWQNP